MAVDILYIKVKEISSKILITIVVNYFSDTLFIPDNLLLVYPIDNFIFKIVKCTLSQIQKYPPFHTDLHDMSSSLFMFYA